jgi:hypothetical protein
MGVGVCVRERVCGCWWVEKEEEEEEENRVVYK